MERSSADLRPCAASGGESCSVLLHQLQLAVQNSRLLDRWNMMNRIDLHCLIPACAGLLFLFFLFHLIFLFFNPINPFDSSLVPFGLFIRTKFRYHTMNMSVHLSCTAPEAIHTPYIDTYSLLLVSPRQVAILAFPHTFYVSISTLLFFLFSFDVCISFYRFSVRLFCSFYFWKCDNV